MIIIYGLKTLKIALQLEKVWALNLRFSGKGKGFPLKKIKQRVSEDWELRTENWVWWKQREREREREVGEAE